MTSSPRNDSQLAELARLRSALEAAGDFVYAWDLASDALTWQGPVERLFGRGGKPPKSGDAFHGRINPEDLPQRLCLLSDHMAGGQMAGGRAYDCEYRVRDRDGLFHWVHDRGQVELSLAGMPLKMTGILRLVSARKEQEARLEQLANYDELTGHFNRNRLREALEQAVAMSRRGGEAGALLAVGIDNLGMINSAYGHEVGDAVLVEVGHRLDRCLRTSDVVGRMGGDRFGVVLTSCPESDAVPAAERVLQAIRRSSFAVGAVSVQVTVSIGLICYPSQATAGLDLMTKAEAALLGAKSAGRNCVQSYALADRQLETYRASMAIGEQVTQALREDRLLFAYQPVVDATSHAVMYHECLLRLMMPDDEVVVASRFIEAVEQLGMMRVIDRRVLELALADLEAFPTVTLAINISGYTAADRSWLRVLKARIGERPDIASRLIIEITETAALHDVDDSARFVQAVRRLGCRVAVDDFGAGYTTFHHLKSLTVDIVKIDGSFVRNLTDRPENQIFVRNLLSLARAFGLKTVAECVEDEAVARYLASEGVELLQGYYFAKPDISPAWRKASAARHKGRISA
ncbi:MAG: putative bifunctional diguanylate cyclase/phosphodiesterase [Kiloniellales bacterium]